MKSKQRKTLNPVPVQGWGWSSSNLIDTKLHSIISIYAWREVKKGCEAEARERSKLEVMRGLLAIDDKARCVEVNCKSRRRILVKRGEGLRPRGWRLADGVAQRGRRVLYSN